MRKFLIMSILVVTFALPILSARRPPRKGEIRKLRKQFAIWCAIYVLTVVYIVQRL
jgi:hypothetical protein